MRILVVSQTRYGVRNVIRSLLRELAADDTGDPAYLTITIHDAPAGVERIPLLSADWLRRYEGNQLQLISTSP